MIKLCVLCAIIFTIVSCKSIPYENDLSFTSSALANSPEYTVFLNNVLCRDSENQIGFCAKRIKSDTDLQIRIPAQSYSFKASLDCTNSLNVDQSYDVIAERDFTITIPKTAFASVPLFNCTVDIYPNDRPEPIAAFARFQINVIDAEYTELQKISRQGDYLVLGQYAYTARVFEDGKWKHYKKTTALKTKSNIACVESYKMRVGCSL